MRWLIMSGLVLSTMSVHADTHLYVSKAAEQKIQVYRLDEKGGSLTAVAELAVSGTPGALAVDPGKKFLFASLRSTSALASYRIDPATGKLELISTVELPSGENAAFVGTDRTGRWLLTASYAAGKVVVYRIGDDGKIASPPVQTVSTAKTAHAVVFSPDHRLVFVPHVGANAIYQFHFDAKTGMLADAGKAPGGAAGAGPRHLAFHPRGKLAFSSDESGLSITAYRYDAKSGLKPLQTLSTLPADYKQSAKDSTAEVKVHPSGKFVWVSNRGHDSLAGFAIDSAAGKLTTLGQTPTARTPRSFEIDPAGRYLFGAGEGDGKLSVYRIDMAIGRLTPLRTYNVGKSLTWVMAVKR